MNASTEIEADSIGIAGGTSSEHATWFLFAAPVAAFVAQFVATDAYYTTPTKVYSGLLAALTAFVLVRYVVARPPRLPAIEYAFALHYTSYGLAATLGALSMGTGNYIPHPDAFEAAAALALASGIALLAGHGFWSLLPPRTTRRRYMPNITPDTLEAASGPYVVSAAVFIVALAVVPSIGVRLSSVMMIVLQFLNLVPLAAVATIVYVLRPTVRSLGQLTIALGSAAVVLVVTSMISFALGPTVAVASLWWRLRGKIPVVLICLAVVLFYVLQPVKSYYRAIMWGDRNADGAVSVVDGWQRAFANAEADRNKSSGSEATRERLSELAVLAYVIELVPSSMPYLGNDAYESTAIALVPRVFWPDKPNMTKTGLDRFMIALGLTTMEVSETSTTGIQVMTHGYASHGVAGAIGWIALFGFVLGAANRFFGQGVAGSVAMCTFMAAWIPFAGAGFVGCFGSLWQTLFGAFALVWGLWALGRLIQKRRAPRALMP